MITPRAVRVFLVLVSTALAGLATAAPAAIPPAPERFLTDTAGFLSPGVRESLDARLQAYERRTGRQFLVWIAPTTGDTPIEDFAVRAFQEWRVGRKGMDDGLVLFVITADRRVRFEVGYGLEPTFPDALASRVINDVLAPRLRTGDADGGVSAAVDTVLGLLQGESEGRGESAAPRPGPGARPPARPLSLGQKVLIALVVLAFLVLLVTNPSLAIYLLFNILSGGRGGGGGGDRGGFSGGGGRSGGGGATGSW